jgi:hypothetical protein
MRTPVRLLAATTAVGLLGFGIAGAVAAAPGSSTTSDGVQAAAGWLTTQFAGSSHRPAPNGDHFEQVFGGQSFPNYGENADVIFGLAAAKSGGTKLDTALDYLATNVDAYADVTDSDGFGPYDGSLGKLAVAAIVGGADPSRFGGYDLMKQLRADECPAGATTCSPGAAANIFASISEAFVLIAEARVGGASAPTPAAVDYFLTLQCSSGGFTDGVTTCASAAADPDSTAYAIMALTAVGGHSGAVASAVSWLQAQQDHAGYWIAQGKPNVNSTGLAAAALAGAGAGVTSARHWLRSQQIAAGGAGAGAISYGGAFSASTVTSGTSPSVLATAQAIPGLVPDGGLATLDAKGSAAGVRLFAPTVHGPPATAIVGRKQTVSASGFAAGERVSAIIHSTPTRVGAVTAAADGTVQLAYRIPTKLPTGRHTIVLTGASSGLSASQSLTVHAAPSTAPAPSTTTTPTTDPIAATGLDGRRLMALSALAALLVIAGVALQAAAGRPTRR